MRGNHYGGISAVAPEFYRDVVYACAQACREPAANIREMKDFVKRYEEHWAVSAEGMIFGAIQDARSFSTAQPPDPGITP